MAVQARQKNFSQEPYQLQLSHVRKLVFTYLRAWRRQDSQLIQTVFTLRADYIEGPKDTMSGRNEIADYWHRRVVCGQSHIRTQLKGIIWDPRKMVAVATWEAIFVDTEQQLIKHMSEFAQLKIDPHTRLIARLDERWAKWSPQLPANRLEIDRLSQLSFPKLVKELRKASELR